MYRTHTIAVSLIIAAALAGAFIPTTSAWSCTSDSWGWGEETTACVFGCSSNEWVGVSGSVDDNGAVNVSGSCGGVSASCVDLTDGVDDGWCYDWSNSPSSYGSNGGCNGTFDGGAVTNYVLRCFTQTAANSSPLTTVDEFIAAVVSGEITSGVYVSGTIGGIAAGLACYAGECQEFVPLCGFKDQLWTCEV